MLTNCHKRPVKFIGVRFHGQLIDHEPVSQAASWIVDRYRSAFERVGVSEISINLVYNASLGDWRGKYADGDTPGGEVYHGPVTFIVIDASKNDPVHSLLHELGHVLYRDYTCRLLMRLSYGDHVSETDDVYYTPEQMVEEHIVEGFAASMKRLFENHKAVA